MQAVSTKLTQKKRMRQIFILTILIWALVVFGWYYRQIIFLVVRDSALTEDYSLSAFTQSVEGLITGGRSVWHFPALGEAIKRAAAGMLGAAVVILAIQLLGFWLLKLIRWQLASWRERALFQTVCGILILYLTLLAFAVLGFYRPQVIKPFFTAVILMGGLGMVIQWRGSRVSLDHLRDSIKQGIKGNWIWLVIVGIAVVMGFIGAIAPEIEYDALWYHLWIPKIWLQQGRMVDLVAEYISLYPYTWELIIGAGLVLGGVVGAKLLGFFLFLMSGLLVYQFSRRFFPSSSAWLAVAIFVTTPIVLWEATTSYIDLVVAFFVGLVFYALFSYIEGRDFKWLVTAAICLGMALATKHLAIVIWIIVICGFTVIQWIETHSFRKIIVSILIFAGLSLLLPLPWYIRNWLASGNPFFPELYAIFGSQPYARWSEVTEIGLDRFKQSFGDPRTPLNLVLLPWNATIHASRYGGTLGPLFLILLPVILAFQRNRFIRWLSISVLVYIIFWASPLSSFQMRFLVPIILLLALLAAQAINGLISILQEIGWRRELLLIMLASLLVLNLPPFLSLHEGDRVKWDGWLTHVLHTLPIGVVVGTFSQDAYLGSKIPAYWAWQFINNNLPKDARVLTFLGGDNFYSERDRLSHDSTLAHPGVWGAGRGEEQEALTYLYNEGITHILFDKRELESGELNWLAITNPSIIADCYTMLYQDQVTVLYRISDGIETNNSTACLP